MTADQPREPATPLDRGPCGAAPCNAALGGEPLHARSAPDADQPDAAPHAIPAPEPQPNLRDHVFLGTTHSLCPECLAVVPAKIIARGGRVYFRKRCSTHGVREDFVCSDVGLYDRLEYAVPARLPAAFGVEPQRGCPYDCGLCSEHEQHTCVGLVEITSNCNLTCPLCYAASGPGGQHLSLDECRRAIDRLLQVEGLPEVLQLSGGEPTIHPQFLEVLDHACRQPIDVVMVNTNGIRLAHDPKLVAALAQHGSKLEVYLQFDGFRHATSMALRGERLLEVKLRAVEALAAAGVRITLVAAVEAGVNEDELGAIVRFGLERPWISGVSFQPATYSGRHVPPQDLEKRVTFPDCIRGICQQTDGLFEPQDFMPLPCAHPNCHSLAYAYRRGGKVVPLLRWIDARTYPELLANGITFTRPRARKLMEQYLARLGCCGGQCGDKSSSGFAGGSSGVQAALSGAAFPMLPILAGGRALAGMGAAVAGPATKRHHPDARLAAPVQQAAGESDVEDFFARVLAEQLSSADVFRITITSFLDAYNFDLRRLMKCCIHHVLPSGHVIPFCAYNVLYRGGHVPLPPLRQDASSA
ncbi:MAG: radical SAM protein [Pirellulales bacterium]|nr:radical SAM protein [Pirellulales bacterium]